MTVRMQVLSQESITVVSIAGRLAGEEATELRRIWADSGGDVLDLSGLRGADEEGITVIRALVREGAKLRGASPFIRLLLAEDSD